MCSLSIKEHILKFQTNWTKHCGDFGMLKSLFLSLHNRGAVGKIVGELSEIKLVTSLLAREIQVHSEL